MFHISLYILHLKVFWLFPMFHTTNSYLMNISFYLSPCTHQWRFSRIYARKGDCFIIKYVYFSFLVENIKLVSSRLYQFTFSLGEHESSKCSYSHQYFILSDLRSLVGLRNKTWYFAVVLICISLIIIELIFPFVFFGHLFFLFCYVPVFSHIHFSIEFFVLWFFCLFVCF